MTIQLGEIFFFTKLEKYIAQEIYRLTLLSCFLGKWMYELMLGSKGVMQVGWCTIKCKFSQEVKLFDKTNKMTCAPSEDSDQPGHPPIELTRL